MENIWECDLCLDDCPEEEYPALRTCEHTACLDCMRRYIKEAVSVSRIDVQCPQCEVPMHPLDIISIIEDSRITQKYERFMIRRALATERDARWCPAPDCGYAVIVSSGEACPPKLKCGRPECGTCFCFYCGGPWVQGHTCPLESVTHHKTKRDDMIRPCPGCTTPVEKIQDGACNEMRCPVCRMHFCWLCMSDLGDDVRFHYLSSSGCTLYGKQKWSTPKKALITAGAMVAAPIGIALAAGVAAPVVTATFPAFVGRKINNKYKPKSKAKKVLAIAGGVVAAIPLAPVAACVAVGAGVVAALGYTYGVLPTSLIKSGRKK